MAATDAQVLLLDLTERLHALEETIRQKEDELTAVRERLADTCRVYQADVDQTHSAAVELRKEKAALAEQVQALRETLRRVQGELNHTP